MQVIVNRKETIFYPDPSRIIARFLFTENHRASEIIRSVMGMSEEDALLTLKQTLRDYSMRHRNISKIFEKHFNKIAHLILGMNMDPNSIDYSKRILIGSYFTMEYSIESAAFFNPSIMEHPDQKETGPGQMRIILSFRATGEGHISSIVFRTGVLDKDCNLSLEPTGKMLEEAEHTRRHVYQKESFAHKLDEMLGTGGIIPPALILDKLNEEFTYRELYDCIQKTRKTLHLASDKEILFSQIIWLASSHYELEFSLDTNISERVIFPVSVNERNGIEDARFVKFIDDNGECKYYATYTAYDGSTILPKLLETSDFYHFKVSPLHGEISINKGMALFPRKIKGKYVMLCRLDGYNNYIAFSDNLNIWREARLLQQPKFPWEFVQIGNGGSPIETEDGWLVITHGVGPMREYVLGASLFDIHHPEKEIGRLKNPLLMPNAKEREGYVPNVVYSCGSMIHNEHLIIPYAMSDFASTYATIHLKELLKELKDS
ncbi:MAG: glycoside hydrolase family 130 protein [Bacteroidales bacterium]|nr:glycoside hydrolase family 130 protein [Bacteroidales bacterium]